MTGLLPSLNSLFDTLQRIPKERPSLLVSDKKGEGKTVRTADGSEFLSRDPKGSVSL